MTTTTKPLAALVAALTVGFGLILATAGAADAQAGPCRVIVERVTAFDIQEGGNGDEIYLKLGLSRFPRSGKVQFGSAPLSRSGSHFRYPRAWMSSSTHLTVWEEDGWSSDDRIGDYEYISCTQPGARLIHFETHNAHYVVDITVTSSA